MSTTKELIQWIDEELGKTESWIANENGCREENLKYKDLMTEIKEHLKGAHWYVVSSGDICCRHCGSVIGDTLGSLEEDDD